MTIQERFETFWKAYPRKVGKDATEKAFLKRKVDDKLLGEMLAALVWQKKMKQWQDRQYIPHPSTWLNQGRWKDEPPKELRQVKFESVKIEGKIPLAERMATPEERAEIEQKLEAIVRKFKPNYGKVRQAEKEMKQ